MKALSWLHVDLDGAWPRNVFPDAEYVDCKHWGAHLRYSTTRSLVREFFEQMSGHRADYRLYGSGDFHHLTALWLRRITEPFTLISFDNHSDWHVRPPHWSCGTSINR